MPGAQQSHPPELRYTRSAMEKCKQIAHLHRYKLNIIQPCRLFTRVKEVILSIPTLQGSLDGFVVQPCPWSSNLRLRNIEHYGAAPARKLTIFDWLHMQHHAADFMIFNDFQ